MNIKRFALAATTFTIAGLFLSACSGTNSASQAPTSSPEVQTQNEVPVASTEPETTPLLQATPAPSASPQTKVEDSGPKMSEKDDADALQNDLDNTQIETENFN